MKIRKHGGKAAAALLCLLLCLTWAFAAGPEGSIRLTVTDEDDRPAAGVAVSLYRVGETDGTLTARFAAADIAPAALADSRNNGDNAETLAAYARSKNLEGGEAVTDSAGQAGYTGLTRGIYLVVCRDGQNLTFMPFLVYIPTVINGAELYDVESEPKAEETPVDPPGPVDSPKPTDSPEPTTSPEPTNSPQPATSPEPTGSPEPTPSTGPGESDLPQTGTNVWPMFILLGLGALLVLAGVIDLLRNRGKDRE